MAAAAMKHMASNFAKLDKFEGVDFERWQKKMHFLLSSMSVVYVLTTPMPEDGGDNPTMEQVRRRAKWDNDDYICRGLILNGMSDSLFDIYHNMAEDASSKKFLVSDFTNYKMTDSRPVLEQYNELLSILRRFTQHKMNMDESIQVSCIIDKLPPSRKDFKYTLKHLKEELTLVELSSIEDSLRVQDNGKPKGNSIAGSSVVNMVEHNNSSRNCKGVNVGNKANGSGIKGSVDGSSNLLKGHNMDDDVAWWVDSGATVHVCKDRCWFKTYESLNDGSILHMGNESIALVHGRGCVDLKFSSRKIVSLLNVLHVPNIRKNLVYSSVLNNCGYKQVTESNKFDLSKHGVFIGFGYLSNHMFRLNIVNDNIDMSKDRLIPAFNMDTEKCKTCMLTKITKKPFLNVKRETKVLELIQSDLHATPSLGNKKYFVTFIDDASRFCYVYLLHTKDEALDKFKVFKTEVELQQGSLIKRFRTDKGGLSQGFWGEAMLTAYYLLNRVPNKRNMIIPYELWTKRKPNLNYLRVWGCRVVVRLPDPKLKTLGEIGIECIFVGYAKHSNAFRFYVIEPNELVSINSIIELRDAIFEENRFSSVPRPSQRSLVKGTEDSGGSVVPEKVTDEKEAINDEMESIMGNNTWVLADLPPGCKPLGCKWIFKRKLKAPKQWHQKFDEVVLSSGYLLNQADKCVYSKFDKSGKGVIICLYVDDTLIFCTGQVQIDLTKEVLSSRFFMKDMGEADVILGIRIKHESNEIAISQSHYIEKVLNKFNQFDCTLVSTLMDTSEKLMPNNGQAVSQLEYSRVIGCLMYAMTYTRPDIAFAVGKLSRYTSNPGTQQHWQAIQRVLKYLKKTIDYRLMYTGYPSVLEGYTDASWISNTEDNSSTSGWVFLLGGGAISWASKKQTCITSSTMEFEFMALAAASKESKWLKNLLLEILL
ncbi:zinc finger, CCHC-type containing protein [Tanacetum coccineum]